MVIKSDEKQGTSMATVLDAIKPPSGVPNSLKNTAAFTKKMIDKLDKVFFYKVKFHGGKNSL